MGWIQEQESFYIQKLLVDCGIAVQEPRLVLRRIVRHDTPASALVLGM